MKKDGPLKQAPPGKQGSMDWLLLKIVECSSEPMDDENAKRLNYYNGAYNAMRQWADSDHDPSPASVGHINGTNERTAKPNVHSNEKLTREQAEDWMSRIVNSDGTNRGHWTIEQTISAQSQRGIGANQTLFYVAMNLAYAIFNKVARKFNTNSVDFYAWMADAMCSPPGDVSADEVFSTMYHEFVE